MTTPPDRTKLVTAHRQVKEKIHLHQSRLTELQRYDLLLDDFLLHDNPLALQLLGQLVEAKQAQPIQART